MPVKSLYFATSFGSLQDKASYDTKNLEKTSTEMVYSSAIKIWDAAEKHYKDNDEEKSYYYYHRFIELFIYLKKRRDFKKNGPSKNLATVAMTKAENLKNSLETRYKALKEAQEKRTKEDNQYQNEEDMVKIGKTAEVASENNISAEKFDDCEPGLTISVKRLYNLMKEQDKSFTVMDVRSSHDFEKSHLSHSCCISIPCEILSPGILANNLEKAIPKKSLEKWKTRKTVDHIILVDWDTENAADLSPTHPLITLKNAMCQWDMSGPLVKEPLILHKGYKEFMFCYPMCTTKVLEHLWSETPSSSSIIMDVSSVDFPDFETVLQDEESSKKNEDKKHSKENNKDVTSNGWMRNYSSFTEQTIVPTINRSNKPRSEIMDDNEPNKSKNWDNNSLLNNTQSNRSQGILNVPEVVKVKSAGSEKPEINRNLKPAANIGDALAKTKSTSDIASNASENLRLRKELEAEESKCKEIQNKEQILIETINGLQKDNLEKEAKLSEVSEENLKFKKMLAENLDCQSNQNDQNLQVQETVTKRVTSNGDERQSQLKKKNVHINKPKCMPTLPSVDKENKSRPTLTISNLPDDEYTVPLKIIDNISEPLNRGLSRSYSSPNIAKLVAEEANSIRKIPEFDRTLKPAETFKSAEIASSIHPDFNPVHGNNTRPCTGLRNLGNTCYMNSTIQCLSNTEKFANYFLQSTYRKHIKWDNKHGSYGEITENFAHLLRALWQGTFKYISARDFKFAAGKYIPMCLGSEQQDSHEFLVVLMDKLHGDLNVGSNRIEPLPDLDNIPEKISMEKFWDYHKSKNRSIISRLFEGLIMSSLTCLSCGKASHSFEAFSCLSLPISSTRCNLKNCLTSFLKKEKLTGEAAWDCPKCKQKKEAEKVLSFCKYPDVLIIQLKRFSYEGMWRQKIQSYVQFPEKMVFPDSSLSRHRSYGLYAVVNHFGYLEGGHYTAFCKNPNSGRWCKYDDQEVTEINSSDIHTSAAYLLFYAAQDS